MPHDTTDSSTDPQPTLADYCEFFLEHARRPCCAETSLMLVRPSGEALRISCSEHLPA